MAFQAISRNYLHILIAQQLVALVRIPLAAFIADLAAVFPNNLALFSKDLKLISLTISALTLIASSFG